MPVTELEAKLDEGRVELEERTLEILQAAEWPAKRIERIMGAWESGHNQDTVHFETQNGKPLTAFLYRREDPEKAVVEEVRPGWL